VAPESRFGTWANARRANTAISGSYFWRKASSCSLGVKALANAHVNINLCVLPVGRALIVDFVVCFKQAISRRGTTSG
jgi:hypothetical protein